VRYRQLAEAIPASRRHWAYASPSPPWEVELGCNDGSIRSHGKVAAGGIATLGDAARVDAQALGGEGRASSG